MKLFSSQLHWKLGSRSYFKYFKLGNTKFVYFGYFAGRNVIEDLGASYLSRLRKLRKLGLGKLEVMQREIDWGMRDLLTYLNWKSCKYCS